MSQRKVNFVDGESYHVYNRGNNKREIFHDAEDYERFKKIIYLCNGTKVFKTKEFVKRGSDIYKFDKGQNLVEVYAYVLMPNHFHLFLTPTPLLRRGVKGVHKTDANLDNNVSTFLKRVGFAYTHYYNRKYQKTGSLFEGTFKAEHVDTDEYYKYLFSYIHLNPVKLIQSDWKEKGIKDFNKAKKFLSEFTHSSYLSYFDPPATQGGGELLINKEKFLEKIDKDINLQKEIFEWLKYKRE